MPAPLVTAALSALARPAGQAIGNWLRSGSTYGPNSDAAVIGADGFTGGDFWSDYSVPTDIPTGIDVNTGQTVVLNPFYVPAGPQTAYDYALQQASWFNPNPSDGSINLVSDPFQIASFTGGGGGATAPQMGPPITTPTGNAVTDVTLTNQDVVNQLIGSGQINPSDLRFGGNLYGPFAGQAPGDITTDLSGVSTFTPSGLGSDVTLNQMGGVTLTGAPVSAGNLTQQDVALAGGNVSVGNVGTDVGSQVVQMGPVSVTASPVGNVGGATNLGPLTIGSIGGASTGGPVQMGPVAVTTSTMAGTNVGTGTNLSNALINQYIAANPNVVQMQPFVTTTSQSTATTAPTVANPNQTITFPNLGTQPAVGPATYVAPSSTASSTATSALTTTGTTGTSAAGGGGAGGGGSAAGTMGGRNYRDFALELGETSAALQANQQNLLNMYGGIYQNFLGQTAIPGAATSAASDLAATQQRLANVRAGVLSPEDLRNSQQAAREAYAARGQVMGPNAIGAEILNREAVRQQREAQAMQAYQNAMGNTLNVANLQTGNIFQPISSLISGTFNPLSPYAADVYGTNVNAQLARDIAAQNNAAAIQAAQFGANATRSAANTQLGANLIGNLVGGIFGGG